MFNYEQKIKQEHKQMEEMQMLFKSNLKKEKV